ncbi:MAG TPA: prepilin-type N-terminal cleavage/methylation domain-containing protein [Verrucomicrobiota bacterium]|nr:prepilin-type N-terminal cleavage/methylation domain-containing protein [Verrucomicrobiota bacterium]
MKMHPRTFPAAATPATARQRAFSLMELMLALGIMAVIVGALYGMFHHTQKALRSNVTQVDVLEAGRAAMDFLIRDFEQLAASDVDGETNLLVGMSPLPLLVNDEAVLKRLYYTTNPPPDFDGYNPVIQKLMGASATRTNTLGEVYLLNRVGDRFIGTSYRVINATNGVGTLARHSGEMLARHMAFGWLSSNILTTPAFSYASIIDRVLHFRIQAYDATGLPMTWNTTNRFMGLVDFNNDGFLNRLDAIYYPSIKLNTNVFIARDRLASETALLFLTNALPSYIEIELGLLEPRAYEQYRAFDAGSTMARQFLQNRAAQVHLFRQRIPIRQADLLQVAFP